MNSTELIAELRPGPVAAIDRRVNGIRNFRVSE